jgi:hypothetical protein
MERDQATLFVPAPHYVASNLDSSTLPKWLEASQISSDGLDTEDFDAIFKLLENQIDPYS